MIAVGVVAGTSSPCQMLNVSFSANRLEAKRCAFTTNDSGASALLFRRRLGLSFARPNHRSADDRCPGSGAAPGAQSAASMPAPDATGGIPQPHGSGLRQRLRWALPRTVTESPCGSYNVDGLLGADAVIGLGVLSRRFVVGSPNGVDGVEGTKASIQPSAANETAARLDTRRRFTNPYGVDARRFHSVNFRLGTPWRSTDEASTSGRVRGPCRSGDGRQ